MVEKVSLRNWSISWERTFKELPNLMFITTIRNIVEYLDEYLKTASGRAFSRNTYEKKLLELLLKRINQRNSEAQIIKNKLPGTITELEQILSRLPNNQNVSQNDINRISILFRRINKFFDSEKFHNEIDIEFSKNLNNNKHEKIDEITLMLIRSLLTKFSQKELEKFPHDVLAKYFFQKNGIQYKIK